MSTDPYFKDPARVDSALRQLDELVADLAADR